MFFTFVPQCVRRDKKATQIFDVCSSLSEMMIDFVLLSHAKNVHLFSLEKLPVKFESVVSNDRIQVRLQCCGNDCWSVSKPIIQVLNFLKREKIINFPNIFCGFELKKKLISPSYSICRLGRRKSDIRSDKLRFQGCAFLTLDLHNQAIWFKSIWHFHINSKNVEEKFK